MSTASKLGHVCPCEQAISGPDERYAEYCASSDFIRCHVFPGGHLPCMGAMVDAARGTGLSVQVPAFDYVLL